MALTGPDGETHSHLSPTEQQNGYSFSGKEGRTMSLPDRGQWVGPRVGDMTPAPPRPGKTAYVNIGARGPLTLDEPESTARELTYHPLPEDPAGSRFNAHRYIRDLLEVQPMVEAQRRILIQALGVLDSFT